jgi:two-component system, sensor histidine kinase and response regulator
VSVVGIVPTGPGERTRVRRKAFDVVRALGGDRDVAARIAGEVADVARSVERHPRPSHLTVSVVERSAGVTVAFTFAGDADVAESAAPPGAFGLSGEGDDRAHPALSYALRIALAPGGLERARAVLRARSREELYASLEASNEALRRTTAEAKRAGEAKAEFLANMSHEIRTPMNAIMGMNRAALATELTPLQRAYLQKIEASSRHLLAVIDDVLDASKLEAGKLTLERRAISLERVLDEVTMLVAPACSEKGLRLSVHVDPDVPDAVEGDALRLRQVLVNLATNAIKFTSEGQVTISLSTAPSVVNEVRLRFAVTDTGIGLSRAEQKHLFASFSQADASITRRYGGTGLGLAISKSLVELMRGEIGVESRSGAGATFWFTARFGRADASARRPRRGALRAPPGEDGAGQGVAFDPTLRILVVEDNRLNQEVAVALLAEVGLTATVVGDGRQALAELRRAPYDLVLMDVQMPVMDGLSATRAIREDPDLADVSVIAMTASALPTDRERCIAAGMNDVVTKPIDPADLWRALRAWVPVRTPPASALASALSPAVADAPVPEEGASERAEGDGPTVGAGADAESLLRGVPGLDVDRGLRFARGKVGLYLDLLRGFVDDQRDLPRLLRESLHADDLTTAERLVHTMRGVASLVGASPLADEGGVLEQALREGAARRAIDEAAEVLLDEHAALFADLDARLGPARSA